MHYVLAYPNISRADRDFIDHFREKHDLPYKDLVAPHFTMVFGLQGFSETHLLRHVEQVCGHEDKIAFDCRYAMLGADHASETAHVFLVPDRGFSAVSMLHDRLYSGPLANALRLDLEYIPHITIGTLENRKEAKRHCDLLNSRPVSIQGSIDEISVVEYVQRTIRAVATFKLQGEAAD